MQGQLGDYNTLVDKLQTDSGLEVFERETTELQRKNANDSASLDDLFAKRKEKVDLIQKAEQEILQQQEMAESLIKTMVLLLLIQGSSQTRGIQQNETRK